MVLIKRKRASSAFLIATFCVVLAASLGLLVILGSMGVEHRTQLVDNNFRRQLLRSAIDLANVIDASLAQELEFNADDQHTPAFEEIREIMRSFGHIQPNRGIYSMRLVDGALKFGPENYEPDDPMASRPGDVYREPPPEAIEIFSLRRPVVLGPYKDEFGSFVAALAPVIDPISRDVVMVVGFDLLADDWLGAMQDARRTPMVRTGILFIVLVLGASLLAYKYCLPLERQRPWRHAEPVLVMVIGLAFVSAISFWMTDAEERERQRVFNNLVDLHAIVLNQKLDRIASQLDMLAAFFSASDYVSDEEFHTYTQPILKRQIVQGIGWIELTGNERWYTTNMEPRLGFEAFRRLDHGTDPVLRAAIEQAIQGHRKTKIGLLEPMPDHDARRYYIIYQTLALNHAPAPGQNGLIFVLLDLSAVLASSFHDLMFDTPFVRVRLEDMDQPAQDAHVIWYPQQSASGQDQSTLAKANDVQHFEIPMTAVGRTFKFSAYPTPEFYATHPARSGRIAGLAGMLLTVLVAAFAAFLRKRQIRLELERSERNYRQLFESMSASFALHELVYDAQGKPIDYRFMQINAAFEKQSGLCAKQIIGRTLYEVMPDSEPIWLARYAPVAIEGHSIQFESYSVQLDRYYDVVAYSPQKGQFATLATDITPRKRMEERLARHEAFQKLLMQMATHFINLPTEQIEQATLDALGQIARFTNADRAYQFQYDFKRRVMIYTHEWCADGVPPEKDVVAEIDLDTDPDWVATHKRGETLYIQDISSLPPESPTRQILESQGIRTLITVPLMVGATCTGFIGFDAVRKVREWSEDEIALLEILAELLSNVHMRKEEEQQRRQLEQQMQQTQKLESLGLLAGGIAHDFNNILTTILGNADLALQDLSPVSPVRENLQDIDTGARRAAELCRQMLAYAGKGTFSIQTFSLNEVIEEMVHLLKTSISKEAIFNLRLQQDPTAIRGDASQIRQIVLNLVINASEALGDGGGTISVSTDFFDCDTSYQDKALYDFNLKPGHYITLEVADTGCGMTPDIKAHIFDPFFTTKFTGRGLGLSAVMGIVRSHGGAMKVYSEPGRGSVFKLLFPAAEAKTARNDSDAQTATEWKGHGGLLLVDDEESIRTLGRRILERVGFTVYVAADGVEALEMFNRHRSELRAVLLDLTMPRKNGEETLREIAHIAPGFPVIIASGYSKEEIASRLSAKGATAFIQKPFSMTVLRETLRSVLG